MKILARILTLTLITSSLFGSADVSALMDPCDGAPRCQCAYKEGMLWVSAGTADGARECNQKFSVCKGRCFACCAEYCTSLIPLPTFALFDSCRDANNASPPPFTGFPGQK